MIVSALASVLSALLIPAARGATASSTRIKRCVHRQAVQASLAAARPVRFIPPERPHGRFGGEQRERRGVHEFQGRREPRLAYAIGG